jgi:hypothetical protein
VIKAAGREPLILESTRAKPNEAENKLRGLLVLAGFEPRFRELGLLQ